jgi:RHS repeat-associated protein
MNIHYFKMIKQTSLALFSLLITLNLCAQTQNFVRTWVPAAPEINGNVLLTRPLQDVQQSTVYVDGWGRVIQTVAKQGSVSQTAAGPDIQSNYFDLVTHVEYDPLGLASKSFLPYVSTGNSGGFKSNAATDQKNFINLKFGEPSNASYTHAQNIYDGSPLNRVINVKMPGSAINNDINYKGISSGYDFYKTTNEYVVNWDFNYTTGLPEVAPIPYADNSLVKNITKDEKDKLIVEYKDLNGNVILKRVQEAVTVSDNSYLGWLNTYYVYDDFGRLRYTITPKAVAAMVQPGGSWSIDPATKKGLCFYQEYDTRGRIIVKHSPDGGEVWLVYDNRDRLVLSQDENQRNRHNVNPAKSNQWSFSLYDENDRVLVAGLINDVRNRVDMQLMMDGLSLTPQNQQLQIYTGAYETITAYNPVTLNTSAADIFINSVNYFDDYSHAPSTHAVTSITVNDFAPTTNQYVETPNVSFKRMRGAATVSKVRILNAGYDNESSTATQFLASTIYYDEKGRSVQTYGDNIKGGVDASSVLYDFSGKVICTKVKHTTQNIPGNDFNGLIIITKNDYDLLGRPTTLWKLYTKNNGDIRPSSWPGKYKKLSEIKFDEFGRTKTKSIGDDPDQVNNPGKRLETMDYSYNIQGRSTGINKDYALATTTGNMNDQWERRFGFYLGYENGDNSFANKQYNGSITGVIWRSQGDNIQRKFDYDYDNVNRFKAANFVQRNTGITGSWSISWVDISVSVGSASVSGYDANGNILRMTQKGIVPGTNGGIILDDLQYLYYSNSNKLQSVTDFANTTISGKQSDFKDYVATNDYDYDLNGNLIYDKNKTIIDPASNQTDPNPNAGIVNNFLDLPQTLTIKGKSKTEYTYDAAGNKLAKKVTPLVVATPALPIVTTIYIGGFVYEETITTTIGPPPVTTTKTELQYILNEEGKLRIMEPASGIPPGGAGALQATISGNLDFGLTKWGVWDYFIKDNLSNTRMVLTEEQHVQWMKCTVEGNPLPANPTPLQLEEQANFGNFTNNEVSDTRFSTSSLSWQPSSYVSKLIFVNPGITPQATVGPNVILKVMAGDVLNATAKFYYESTSGSNNSNSNIISNIANSLFGFLQNPGNVNSTIKDNISNAFLSSSGGPIQPFLTDKNPSPVNGNTPKAFLNYIFFDEQFRYVPEASGAFPVSELVGQQTSISGNVTIPANSAKATKNGYVYIYLSNESSNVPVYFDDFIVTHNRGVIVEDNAYYPFGLKIQGISARAAGKPKTRQGYQGQFNEQDDETGYNEFALRSYDPQIGRWLQVDPKTVQSGMYNGMGDDPVNQVDPDGAKPTNWYAGLVNGILTTVKDVGNTSAKIVQDGFDLISIGGDDMSIADAGIAASQIYGGIPYLALNEAVTVTSVTWRRNFPVAPREYVKEIPRESPSFWQVVKNLSQNAPLASQRLATGMTYNIANDAYIASKNINHTGWLSDLNGDLVGADDRIRGSINTFTLPMWFVSAPEGAALKGAGNLNRLVGFGTDAAIVEGTANLIPRAGWYDVIVHGTKDGLAFTMKGAVNPISAEELYGKMLANGYEPGTKIRLMSCYSGSLPNGAAAELSKLANAPVWAPQSWMSISDGLGIYPKGTIKVGDGLGFKIFK